MASQKSINLLYLLFFIGVSGSAFSKSLMHRGTSSTCQAACEDARDMAGMAHEEACRGSDYQVLYTGQTRCLDGGDYDVNCTYKTEITCGADGGANHLEHGGFIVGPEQTKYSILHGECGEIDLTLGDKCFFLGTSERTDGSKDLFGLFIDSDSYTDTMGDNPQEVVGTTIKVPARAITQIDNRSFEHNLLGQVKVLARIQEASDPRLLPPERSSDVIYRVLYSICGELSPELGDQCYFVVRTSQSAIRIYQVDQDVAEPSLGTEEVQRSEIEWIKVEESNTILDAVQMDLIFRILVNQYVTTDEWTFSDASR